MLREIDLRDIDTSAPEYPQLLQFRNKLLRQPLGLDIFQEDLSDDAADFIIIALHNDHIIGCVMLHPVDNDTVKLRQMAVAEPFQHKGLGRILVTAAEETAWEHGFRNITLHARMPASGFYEKLGYKTFGHEFIEVTLPHIAMKKALI